MMTKKYMQKHRVFTWIYVHTFMLSTNTNYSEMFETFV